MASSDLCTGTPDCGLQTAFTHFYLPVALAMRWLEFQTRIRVQVPNRPSSPSSRPLFLLQIGEYFQIQDDFLDYTHPTRVVAKVGTGTKPTQMQFSYN